MFDEALPKQAMMLISESLGRFMGRELTLQRVHEMEQALYDASVRVRLKGIGLPKLVLIYLERRGRVYIVRADLEHAGIQRLIQNMVQENPGASPLEFANAVRRAFPNYRIDDAGQTAVTTMKRMAEKEARNVHEHPLQS